MKKKHCAYVAQRHLDICGQQKKTFFFFQKSFVRGTGRLVVFPARPARPHHRLPSDHQRKRNHRSRELRDRICVHARSNVSRVQIRSAGFSQP